MPALASGIRSRARTSGTTILSTLGVRVKRDTEDEMNGYATHELATIRQQELLGEANRYRLAKEARLATRGTAIPARRPLISLRKAISMMASRLATAPKHAPAAHR